MKVGIIGLGARITNLAALFKQSKPDYEFAAYVDPTPAGLDFLIKSTGDRPVAYERAEDMLATEDLGMVMIGSPNHLHLEHLRSVLRADVPHIFVEKPVVISEEQTWDLLELMRDNGGHSRIMIGLVLRYSPLYIALKEAQRKGQIGKVVSIEASEHIGPHHGSFFMRDWRRYSSFSGGFMLEKCCHDIDLYQGVVGQRPRYIASFGGRKSFVPENRPESTADYERISAEAQEGYGPDRIDSFSPRWGGGNSDFESDGDIIDYQTAIVEYEDGASMAFHTNMNVPDEFRRFAVIGTKGMAEGDFIRNTFRVTDALTARPLVESAEVAKTARLHHYGADNAIADDIAAHIERGIPLKVTVLDALEAGLTAIKMDEARLERKVIDMAEIWEKFDSYGLRREV